MTTPDGLPEPTTKRQVSDHDTVVVIEFVALEPTRKHAWMTSRQEGFYVLCPLRRAEDRHWGQRLLCVA